MTTAAHDGYLQALGLQRSPFPPTPDAQAYFHTGALQRELAEAAHCLLARKGFVLVTGEVGMGKSTFVRRLIGTVEAEGAAVSLVLNTFLQGPQLLAAVLRDFGLEPGGDVGTDLNRLDAFLLRRWQAGSTSVLIIDDAQNLTLESLELLRLLSSLESGQEKLLQIVLVGQPELAEHLAEHAIRQLASRIVKHIELRPFSAEETARYVAFRLDLAGAGGRIGLSAGALVALQRYSLGNPRRIHLVMDRCLYGLVARGGGTIDPLLLAAAVAEAGFQPRAPRLRGPFPRLGSARLSAALLLLVGSGLAMATGLALQGHRAETPDSVPLPPTTTAVAGTPTPTLAHCIDGLGAAPAGQAELHLQRVDAAQAALLGVREGVCLERRDAGWLAAWHDAAPADPTTRTRQLQQALAATAARPADFIDGRYGPDTRAAVAGFQRAHGLPATGQADPLTLLLLSSAPAERIPAPSGNLHVRR